MSVVDTNVTESSVVPATPRREEATEELAPTSPFAPSSLVAAEALEAPPELFTSHESLTTPFSEAMASVDESDLEGTAVQALIAELEDEEFAEALEALTNEAAARHLVGAGGWSREHDGWVASTTEVEQWVGGIGATVDRRLGELEALFAERTIDSITEAEIESIDPEGEADVFLAPLDAQEYFLKKVFGKVKKAVRGVRKLVTKGVGALSKLLPVGKLFGLLRKLITPLLQKVLQKAIGKLPPAVQPVARSLAQRLGLEAELSADGFGGEPESGEFDIAEEFDATLAEAVLAPSDALTEGIIGEFEVETVGLPDRVAGADPVGDLDVARRRLAEQLAEAETGRPPTEQLEQFIPVVMAAMPLIKLGVKAVGRERIVGFVADLLAKLIQGMVGREPARMLSRHIASAGLGLLGLEAEAANGNLLGTEGLTAAVEDTVREVMSMAPESLANELLLEASVQEAFEQAAVRHLPAEALRPELVEGESEDEHGVWVMMPRGRGSIYRFKKYSRVVPVRISRPLARRIVLSEGDTLEERALDAGASRFPLEAEIHVYELLPGGAVGHLAASEPDAASESYADSALEFEELAPARPLPLSLPQPRHRMGAGRLAGGVRGARPAAGRRFVRLKARGVRLRRRSRFALRLDLTGTRPELRVHLRLGERQAHALSTQLQQRRHVQVVAGLRRILSGPRQKVMAARLHRMLARRRIQLPEGASGRLAETMSEAIGRSVAKELPAAAAALATAARDPATGVTLTFAFTFASRDAFGKAELGDPTMSIQPGMIS